MAIERCAVLGAGLMGSGIAAHLANAGLPVLLPRTGGKYAMATMCVGGGQGFATILARA